jgi:hypothetical protein
MSTKNSFVIVDAFLSVLIRGSDEARIDVIRDVENPLAGSVPAVNATRMGRTSTKDKTSASTCCSSTTAAPRLR